MERFVTPPNLNGKWHNLEISKVLSEKIGKPVYLDNDANLAGLAEAVVSEGKDCNIVQYLTVSTGLGAGFVINKEVYFRCFHGFCQRSGNSIMIQDGPSHGKHSSGRN